jgi:NAD(P)H-dependent FMN reductase
VSSNGALLRAARRLAPDGVTVTLYDGLAELPQFNPDLDLEPAAAPVAALRARLAESAGVVISSPEYAHGVPGALKNALDWIVSSGELVDKPVALLNASPMATHAHASLAETLMVMSARLVPEASGTIPVWGRALDESAIAADPALGPLVRDAMAALVRAIRASSPAPSD